MAEMKLTFKLNDGTTIDVPKKYLYMMKTISDMLSDMDNETFMDEIPITSDNITHQTMVEILTYCLQYYENGPGSAEEKLFYENYDLNQTMAPDSQWDKDFFSKFSLKELERVMNAANFLNMPGFVERSCKYLGETHINGKTPEQMREMFGLPDDLTAEEKEKINKENAWCTA